MDRSGLDARLLATWERGLGETPLERGLLLLELAHPERTLTELARVSIGRRDRALVALRERLFGAAFDGHVDCPACGERLAVELDLVGRHEDDSAPAPFVSLEGLAFRAPDSNDVASITDATTADEAVRRLLTLCCTSANSFATADWNTGQIAEIEAGISTLEVDDEISIDFTCDACGHLCQTVLDPASVLWEELESHAIRLLRAVHRLAAAYGWTEREILALSPARRAAYLQMVES
jgi:hypothetical protein